MIDRPDQVERLMERLGAALPIPARPTPELQATLQKQNGITLPGDCRVTWVSYAGDEGGIVCRLERTSDMAEAVVTSITHLRFDPRLPVARDVVTYQKHRVKHLRRQQPQPRRNSATRSKQDGRRRTAYGTTVIRNDVNPFDGRDGPTKEPRIGETRQSV